MKHFRAETRMGYTFGMDVETTLASRALKKTFYQDQPLNQYNPNTIITRRCIHARDVASMMGEVAWLVTEAKDFVKVQIGEDGPWLHVVYA